MQTLTEKAPAKKSQKFRTRLFPRRVLPKEEIARRKAARAEFGDRCRAVFDKAPPY